MEENPFARAYPHLAEWATGYGWIEIGQDDYSRTLVRVLDIGGMVWEGGAEDDTLDTVLQEAESAVEQHMREVIG